MGKLGCVMMAMVALAAAPAAYAVDGISFEIGDSDSSNVSVQRYRVGLQWNLKKKVFDAGDWHVAGYWDLNFGYWNNRSAAGGSGSIAEVSLTPVLRVQQSAAAGLSPYAETGVGLHIVSYSSVSTQRELGTNYQFGSHIGAGVRFGDKRQYDIGYRYQHLSNAGIKEPNQGINFHQLRLQYHF